MKSSPRRARKEKDVFKFLKESDANYTVRRQQLQMNLILEKNKDVKQVCFVGVVDVKPPVLRVMHIILCLVLSLMSPPPPSPFPPPPPPPEDRVLDGCGAICGHRRVGGGRRSDVL